MLNTSLIGTHKTFADGAFLFDSQPKFMSFLTILGVFKSHLNNSKEIDVITMPQCFRITYQF